MTLKNEYWPPGLIPQKPVVEIMTSPVETISENALLYEALLSLKDRNISHLATVDERNKITWGYRLRGYYRFYSRIP